MRTVVVTDSTASLPAELAAQYEVEVIPLHVMVGRETKAEGVDISGAEVAELLRSEDMDVTTSGPAPGEFVQFYRDVARRREATQIVSVHLSGRISRTVESAQLAGAAVADEVSVTVVDSRTLGLAMGYAVCKGASLAAEGVAPTDVADAIEAHCRACWAYFYVDTLEYLRRGGRIGAASALVGSALAIKPLLTLADGEVQPWERVRTRNRAMARLRAQTMEHIATLSAQGSAVRVGVHHCDVADRALEFAEGIQTASSNAARVDGSEGSPSVAVDMVELGAVTSVHTGPGTLAVVISPDI
ncbi:MAG: DegV family protein [Ornithinimicrobium sp.]